MLTSHYCFSRSCFILDCLWLFDDRNEMKTLKIWAKFVPAGRSTTETNFTKPRRNTLAIHCTTQLKNTCADTTFWMMREVSHASVTPWVVTVPPNGDTFWFSLGGSHGVLCGCPLPKQRHHLRHPPSSTSLMAATCSQRGSTSRTHQPPSGVLPSLTATSWTSDCPQRLEFLSM